METNNEKHSVKFRTMFVYHQTRNPLFSISHTISDTKNGSIFLVYVIKRLSDPYRRNFLYIKRKKKMDKFENSRAQITRESRSREPV